MDDPIFDPWGAQPQAPAKGPPDAPPAAPATAPPAPPAAASAVRWRSPAGPAPTPPPSPYPGPEARRPTAVHEPARLAGTSGFLRSMAVPRLEEVARRLQLARHEASVEDQLEATPPTLRFSLRPWRGPWTEELSPPRGTLVLSLEGAGASEDAVSVHVWLDPEAEEPTDEMRVAPGRVNAAWLERLVLDFVERVFARA